MIYNFNKEYIQHLCAHQKQAFLETLSEYEQDSNSVHINYVDRNYECMPMFATIRDSKTCAISMFSGCGGLDIGTQMAGVRIISTLDFEPATVETVKANKFFSLAEHNCADVRNITGEFYSNVIKKKIRINSLLLVDRLVSPFPRLDIGLLTKSAKHSMTSAIWLVNTYA